MRATPFDHVELKNIERGNLDQFHNPICDTAVMLAQEVMYQREWLARVAQIIEVQALDMPKLAKCRRSALESTVQNLRDLALGRNVQHIPSHLRSEYDRIRIESE